MATQDISGGTVHELPADLHDALLADPKVLTLWEEITPLARNEFICWVEDAKQLKTRQRRIQRTSEELLEGKRRPCCWIGCVHRTDKAISPSVQGILEKRAKKSS
ncbi:MAG: YdeI/OmpD-associated family protein [Thermomicrobiales bacterium]|nr:YdeI/OmpD-associated family protein [Thermomicrobiales bacterium]MCO5221415.1 YdeI/OmpD-associated family protein [Thermomicrobiales bacterium]